MRATDVCKALKETLGVQRNEEIVPAVEALLGKRKATPPNGVLIVMSEGVYYPTVVGMPRPTLAQVEALREACLHFAEAQLGRTANTLREREIEARVRKELEERGSGE